MRAVVLTAHGGPENLEYVTDYPDPSPGPGEVLVKISACSLNYHDVFTRRGMPGIRVPLPVVPGLDIAGEVAALGPGIEGVAIGARVLVDPIYPGVGLMGEMRDGRPQRRSYEGGIDVVVNYTGGDTWVPSLKVLKRGGRLLVCGATAGFAPTEDLRYIWSFELKILGSNAWARGDLESLMQLAASRRLVPVIDRVLPLSEGRAAVSLLEDRAVFGKVVVTP